MPLLDFAHTTLSRRQCLAWLGSAYAALPVWAAESGLVADSSQPAELTGTTSNGQRATLSGYRGRVVLVFYWSTGCPVCLDKMSELRSNLAGWRHQPFTLLGVNMDARREDFTRYEAIAAEIVHPEQRFISVWGNDTAYRDTLGVQQKLPSAVLINKQGEVAQRYAGRIPAQAWDHIADLL